jgi:L-aspartate oxidase
LSAPPLEPYRLPGHARRLAAFDPRQVPQYRFDLLVVGGGAAGGAAALAAAESGVQVALLVKGRAQESNTHYAQGGMAAVLGDDDSFESHVADTLRVGCGLAEAEVVERVVRGGPAAVDALRSWGACFDLKADGTFDLSREGGHSRARVAHARGDATGREIQEAVTRALEEHPGVTVFEACFLVDLIQGDGDRVVGALAHTAAGEPVAFLARQVVLATGGAGQLYRETTNPVIATGDGVALGFRAGAAVQDPEFFQFHPTCLYIAGAARVLISEIVRGAGGVLRDRSGARFLPDAHPDAELAPRDVVSRAVFERMVATGDTNVYLDLSGLDRDPHRIFPGISRVCRYFGIDIAKDPVPVRPGAHYMIGGLLVDTEGRTTVPGLWAAGEVASSGLHGANRMGSNSLLEAVVLGAQAGHGAAREAANVPLAEAAPAPRGDAPPSPPAGMRVNVEDVTYSLKSLMWRALGVVREERTMCDALEKIELWTRTVRELAPPEPRTWELINMLSLARLVTLGGLARQESRGVHWRADFPAEDEGWRAHTLLRARFEDACLVAVDHERVALPTEVSGAAAVLP